MIIKAKKSLGQNFLFDKNILNIIINCADIKDKNILEIGPGTGNITIEIIKKNQSFFKLLVTDRFSLKDIDKAFKFASTGKGIKILIKP